MTLIAATLFRGELRAQGLVGRNHLITVLQALLGLAVIAAVAHSVRNAVLEGHLPSNSSLALASLGGFGVIVVNVVTVASSTRTGVHDLQRFVRPLPVTRASLRGLLVLTGMARSALFTLTVLGAVAVGVTVAQPRAGTVSSCLAAVLLLPTVPAIVGLHVGARWGGRLSPTLALMPLAAVLLAVTVPLPSAGRLLDPAAAVVDLPARVLLGEASPSSAFVLLVGWSALAALLAARLDVATAVDPLAARPPLARLLGDLGRSRVVADLAVHRVRVGDLAVALAPGVLVAGVMVALQLQGQHQDAAILAVLLGVPLTVVTYSQVATVVEPPPQVSSWLATLPLRSCSVERAARTVAVSVAVGVSVVAVTPLLVRGLAGDGTSPAAAAATISGALLAALSIRVVRGLSSWRRVLAAFVVVGIVLSRTLALMVLLLVTGRFQIVAPVVLTDLALAGVLALVGRRSAA